MDRFALYKKVSREKRVNKVLETYKSHLVCQDTVLQIPPVVAQPVHAVDLERHQLELVVLPQFGLGPLLESELPSILVFSTGIKLCELLVG